MTENRITVRTPDGEDALLAARDMLTMRSGPPLLVALAIVFFLSGSPVLSLLGVSVTGYLLSLWERLQLVKTAAPKVDGGVSS
jgi:hypothetical protein